MSTVAIDLSALPLAQVVKLKEEADRQVSDRRCRSALDALPYVGCTLETGHSGPHTSHGRANPPDSARPEYGYEITWKRIYDNNGARLVQEEARTATPSAMPTWHNKQACPVLGGCTRCRSVVTAP